MSLFITNYDTGRAGVNLGNPYAGTTTGVNGNSVTVSYPSNGQAQIEPQQQIADYYSEAFGREIDEFTLDYLMGDLASGQTLDNLFTTINTWAETEAAEAAPAGEPTVLDDFGTLTLGGNAGPPTPSPVFSDTTVDDTTQNDTTLQTEPVERAAGSFSPEVIAQTEEAIALDNELATAMALMGLDPDDFGLPKGALEPGADFTDPSIGTTFDAANQERISNLLGGAYLGGNPYAEDSISAGTSYFEADQLAQIARQYAESQGKPLVQDGKIFSFGDGYINRAVYGDTLTQAQYQQIRDSGQGYVDPTVKDSFGFDDVLGIGAGILGGMLLGPAIGALGGKISAIGGPAAGIAGGTSFGSLTGAVGGTIQNSASLLGGLGGLGGGMEAADALDFAAASGTPYGNRASGVLAGPPPDDYADTDFGDMSSIIDNTRMTVQIPGLPALPTWGMKIEDIQALPQETWDWVKDVASGSTNPIEDVANKIKDAVGGTIDNARRHAETILAGASGIYQAMQDNNIIVNATETPDPDLPVTGVDDVPYDEAAQGTLTTGNPTNEASIPGREATLDRPSVDFGGEGGNGLVITHYPTERPGTNVPDEGEYVFRDDLLLDTTDDPVIEDVINDDPVVEGPVVDNPDELTEDPVVDEPVVNDPVTGTPGGGVTSGMFTGGGDSNPFMTGIDYESQIVSRKEFLMQDFLAELMER